MTNEERTGLLSAEWALAREQEMAASIRRGQIAEGEDSSQDALEHTRGGDGSDAERQAEAHDAYARLFAELIALRRDFRFELSQLRHHLHANSPEGRAGGMAGTGLVEDVQSVVRSMEKRIVAAERREPPAGEGSGS